MEDKNTLLAEARELLNKSSLTDEEKALWLSRLENAPMELIGMIIELFRDDDFLLPIMTNNLKKKIEAESNPSLYETIMMEEIQIIQQVISGAAAAS